MVAERRLCARDYLVIDTVRASCSGVRASVRCGAVRCYRYAIYRISVRLRCRRTTNLRGTTAAIESYEEEGNGSRMNEHVGCPRSGAGPPLTRDARHADNTALNERRARMSMGTRRRYYKRGNRGGANTEYRKRITIRWFRARQSNRRECRLRSSVRFSDVRVTVLRPR